MSSTPQFTSIGGQAVIEGVMMRSPHFIAVAVRKSNQRILIRSFAYSSWGQRSFFKKPIVRGVITLVESMIQGIEALTFSAQVAADEEDSSGSSKSELSNWAMVGTLFMAFVLGMGLFVALPHGLTVGLTHQFGDTWTAQDPFFHLVDGSFKILILLLYVYLIGKMKEIHRVFQYHGAEHKSIYTFEARESLTVENAKKHTPLHPRCGTSFLLFLVLISVGVFSIVFPLFHLTQLSPHFWLNHLLMVIVKIFLMLPVAGLAYELIKACAFRMDRPFFRFLIWPGLILQKFTTREPTEDQLEVALASLKQVLGLEKMILKDGLLDLKKGFNGLKEIEISSLQDLGEIVARVEEFPEI